MPSTAIPVGVFDSSWRWEGDLDDDCTARDRGLMLRAEKMDRKVWWWAVLLADEHDWVEIAASHDRENNHARTGREARILAERAAWHYLAAHGTRFQSS